MGKPHVRICEGLRLRGLSLLDYRDDTTIIFAWKKEFDEKEKNTFGMVN